jgi:hypothetical protein
MRRVRDSIPKMRMTILLLGCMLAAMHVSGKQEAKLRRNSGKVSL